VDTNVWSSSEMSVIFLNQSYVNVASS